MTDTSGMRAFAHDLPATTSQADLLMLIDPLNRDPTVNGILVQLPLPAGIDSHAVLDRVDPAKDVDGFHPHNVGLLQQGRPGLTPCTPAGIMELLRREGIELAGRRVVVVGRSDIVSKPMAMMLLHAHATVTLCHSRTRDLAAVTRQAEILVVAAGRLALVGAEHVDVGAVVVDVGNATILPGITIGAGAMFGAGSVVTRSVPPNAIVVGNPAKIVGYVNANTERVAADEKSAAANQHVTKSKVAGVALHTFRAVSDMRGSLSVGEFEREIPFIPQRYFLVYDVPTAETRGEHAHLKCINFSLPSRVRYTSSLMTETFGRNSSSTQTILGCTFLR